MNPSFVTLIVIALILAWVGIRFFRVYVRLASSETGMRVWLTILARDGQGRAKILEAADAIRSEDALAGQRAYAAFLKNHLVRANEICRSMHAIAERDGRETNWAAFRDQLNDELNAQQAILAGERGP
jgi:hypothetical protein